VVDAGVTLPSRILVTGGAGFIGSHVVRAAVDRGAHVLVVDDLSTGDRRRVPKGVDVEVLDVRDARLARIVAAYRPELVVHAAARASVTASLRDPDGDHAINVVGTQRVVEAARRASARIVFLSSGGAVYGETRGATEDEPPRPENPYGRHKLQAEALVRTSGLPYAIARLANVYGPGQRADLEGGVVAIFADRLSAGEPVVIYGDGEQSRDFVHVADVVSAILLLGSRREVGTWNVGSGVATTILRLLAALEAVIRPAVAVEFAPPRPGDVRHSCLVATRLRALGWAPSLDLIAGLETVAPQRTTARS
jgi:UDP-glucose 4-epimerase